MVLLLDDNSEIDRRAVFFFVIIDLFKAFDRSSAESQIGHFFLRKDKFSMLEHRNQSSWAKCPLGPFKPYCIGRGGGAR